MRSDCELREPVGPLSSLVRCSSVEVGLLAETLILRNRDSGLACAMAVEDALLWAALDGRPFAEVLDGWPPAATTEGRRRAVETIRVLRVLGLVGDGSSPTPGPLVSPHPRSRTIAVRGRIDHIDARTTLIVEAADATLPAVSLDLDAWPSGADGSGSLLFVVDPKLSEPRRLDRFEAVTYLSLAAVSAHIDSLVELAHRLDGWLVHEPEVPPALDAGTAGGAGSRGVGLP